MGAANPHDLAHGKAPLRRYGRYWHEPPRTAGSQGAPGTAGASYQRYAATPNGVSPLVFPGHKCAPDTVVKDHLGTSGKWCTPDSAADIKAMKDKRHQSQSHPRGVNVIRQRQSMAKGSCLVFAYGSTVLELREAQKYSQCPFKIIAPSIWNRSPMRNWNSIGAKRWLWWSTASPGFLPNS